jgi:putative DNA primase/helicase
MYDKKRYGISNINKIKDAIELAMLQRVKHPVKEYLENLEWDGIQRAEELFIYYLGANDTSYVREVTKKALLGAVARIYSPGCKHDHMLVLVGPQGCLKSTTLVKLGKTWFSDSLYTLSGKDAYEQLQGYWILELSEMAATRKAEIEQIKQFISKQEDNYRAAYARRAQSHPRQCAFFGTTNDDDFLRDPTGGRRFWPVRVTDIGRRLGRRLDDSTVDQIWAEIVVRYKAGETWYLSDSMEAEAREVQQLHTESNGKLGLVENFVSRKIPADWDDWTYDRRMLFWSDSFNEGLILVSRTKICAIELWQELFKGDVKAYTPTIAREMTGLLKQLKGWEYSPYIHSGVPYGKQRGFIFADSQNSQ